MTLPRFRWRTLHAILFLAVALPLWLVPFFKAGWKGSAYRELPRAVRFQYNAAGLFTRRSTMWWDHHLERDGDAEVPERDHFPMGAFGYRTRLDRILNESQRSGMRDVIRRRIAEHVVFREKESRRLAGAKMDSRRLPEGRDEREARASQSRKEGQEERSGRERNADSAPSDRPLEELRIVRSLWKIGDPVLAHPEGAWSPPPVTELHASQRQVLGAWRVESDGSLLALGAVPGSREAPGSARVVRRVRGVAPFPASDEPSSASRSGVRAAKPVRVVREK